MLSDGDGVDSSDSGQNGDDEFHFCPTKIIIIIDDSISFENNIQLLKKQLIKYVGDVKFKECQNMGDILETILVFVKRNYQDVLTK